ncbi:MAG: hypothetical protein WAW85_12075, partial [Gordonia sp. (in: high G+C Gram-positive bacteria)]|uniref:hypothetical protein n=1 Tax=Gordonia sp. (in: high G+C Gram-positive bacteria) TaxID=84139 RepID=UPI003BB5518E
RPVGRSGPWLVNPIFHPDKLATGHHAAGLTTRMGEVSDTDPPRESASPQWESGVEAIFEQHLAA